MLYLQLEKKEMKFFKEIFFQYVLYASTLVRKMALSNMPETGFDIYLLDKKVVDVMCALDKKNSSLACQILWAGFKTEKVPYTRLAREIGRSRWTLSKKVRLVMDTLFSFSTVPIKVVTTIGMFSFCGALIWVIVELICKLSGLIEVTGWTTLFIFNLFSFGVIMLTLGILGEYLWGTFDASRNRPPFIVEEKEDK